MKRNNFLIIGDTFEAEETEEFETCNRGYELIPTESADRIYLRILDRITQDMYDGISLQLISLISNHITADIVIYIDSTGGDFLAAYNIARLLNSMPNRIITVAYHECCSAACLIFATGEKRYMLEGTTYILHQVRGRINTQAHGLQISEIRVIENEMKRQQNMYKDAMLAATGIPPKTIEKILRNPQDTILSESEILEYKIATKIFKKWDEIDI